MWKVLLDRLIVDVSSGIVTTKSSHSQPAIVPPRPLYGDGLDGLRVLDELIVATTSHQFLGSEQRTEDESRPEHCLDSKPSRVLQMCFDIGLASARLKKVPPDYYDLDLESRRKILNAPSISCLCKSIVMENEASSSEDCTDPLNSRYYCVIVQYGAPPIHKQRLQKFVRSLKPQHPPQFYHFRMAPNSDDLTGFEHNAICPVGMTTPIPIILALPIRELQWNWFWMGGGAVDVKLGCKVTEFIAVIKPFVADIYKQQEDSKNELV